LSGVLSALLLAGGVFHDGVSHMVFLTSGSSWTVPAGVTSAQVDCIGGGGDGAVYNAGGGGAWSRHPSLTLTPGGVINYHVGIPGNTNTWFDGTTFASASVGAQGGSGSAAGNDYNRPNTAATLGFSGGTASTGGSPIGGGAAGFHGNGVAAGAGDAGYGGATGYRGAEYDASHGSGGGGAYNGAGGLYGGGGGGNSMAGAIGLIVLVYTT